MCNLCDEKTGGQSHCQDCGRMICFDNEPDNIDVIDQAYVTASGDLYCRRCGSSYDQAEEEYDDGTFWDEYAMSWYDRGAPDLAEGEDATHHNIRPDIPVFGDPTKKLRGEG